jgi:hypothetical protein
MPVPDTDTHARARERTHTHTHTHTHLLFVPAQLAVLSLCQFLNFGLLFAWRFLFYLAEVHSSASWTNGNRYRPSTCTGASVLIDTWWNLLQGFTFEKSTSFPQNVCVCMNRRTNGDSSVCSTDWSVCVTDTECVYCAVRTETFSVIQVKFRFKDIIS